MQFGKPYITYIKNLRKKGKKNVLNYTKKMLLNEILCHKPGAKVNHKNKSALMVMEELSLQKLTDPADLKFIFLRNIVCAALSRKQ